MRHADDSSSSGQGLVEFALILPLLMLFVFGLFDLGYATFLQNSISNGAREGARAGIIKNNTDATIRARVLASTPGIGPQITIQPSTRTFTDPITVTVTYTYTPMTPLIGNFIGHIHLSSTSVMIVEGVEIVPP